MKQVAAMERRIQKIKQQLAKVGDMRPGSLSVQTRSWGGQYCQLSYTHQGKGHTEYVPDEARKQIERHIANYKKFRDLTTEWVELAIQVCKLKTQAKTKPKPNSPRRKVEK